jgi:HTH-type transcriptional regulator/antitoxin HigA
MPEIARVQNEAEYDAALARISELLDAELNTPEREELDRISTLVEIYEAEHYPMDGPNPNSLLEFVLDQRMVSRERMEALAGGSDCLDAVLEGRKAVTPELAQLLHEHTGIPIEHLLESQAQDTTVVIAD